MLVNARLFKRLCEQLGEELANDLVELFNQVDSTSRSDLRELNELNFARFDAKLEQRIAEVNARIDRVAAELNARIDKVAAELSARIDQMASKADLAALEAKMEKRFGDQATELARQFTGQQRLLYFAMAMQITATLSLWLR